MKWKSRERPIARSLRLFEVLSPLKPHKERLLLFLKIPTVTRTWWKYSMLCRGEGPSKLE
jgi:hypothetical protein